MNEEIYEMFYDYAMEKIAASNTQSGVGRGSHTSYFDNADQTSDAGHASPLTKVKGSVMKSKAARTKMYELQKKLDSGGRVKGNQARRVGKAVDASNRKQAIRTRLERKKNYLAGRPLHKKVTDAGREGLRRLTSKRNLKYTIPGAIGAAGLVGGGAYLAHRRKKRKEEEARKAANYYSPIDFALNETEQWFE